jgi:hypothetical protein
MAFDVGVDFFLVVAIGENPAQDISYLLSGMLTLPRSFRLTSHSAGRTTLLLNCEARGPRRGVSVWRKARKTAPSGKRQGTKSTGAQKLRI